jgi:hypothetical protein
MDPISNVDQLVLLLRQRLTERSRASPGGQRDRTHSPSEPTQGSVHSVQALAALEDVDEHQLKRAVIQSILAEHFGAGLVNDAKFQQVVDRVTETLESETGAPLLFAQVVRELRSSGR